MEIAVRRGPSGAGAAARALPGEPAGAEALVADPGGRAPEIDAIRGWAALSVVCFHVFWETFGAIVPPLRNPYTAGLLAGHFDVILFFVLSGDALSFPFLHGGGARYLQRAALKRYPRLAVPIVAVTAVTALAMAAGLAPTAAAGAIVAREDWLGSFARFNAGGASAARFAFFFVFEGGYPKNYLPFLWTMPVELLGSFVLLLVLLVYPRVRGARWIVGGLALALLAAENYCGCFLVGLLLGDARARGLFARVPRFAGLWLAPAGAVAMLALAGRRQVHGDQRLFGLAVIGALLLACLYASPAAMRVLRRDPFSQFLGRISYLLYLWHYLVLITATAGLVVWLAGPEGVLGAGPAVALGVATVLASLALARATLPLEGWTRTVNAALLAALWREEAPAPARPQR